MKTKNFIYKFVEILPVATPVFIALFGCVTMVLLLLGSFRTELIVSVGLAVSLPALFLLWKVYQSVQRPGSKQEQRLFDWLFLISVLAWVGINAIYTAQNVFVYRDPAIYTVTAEHLRENDNLQIKATDAFDFDKNLVSGSAGFSGSLVNEKEIYAQGQHLLPALLSTLGKIFGSNLMLHAAPLFGGAALLAIYGFARYIVKPRWAYLAVLTLGLSLPFLYFSRDTYTEPLAAIFTFGALSLVFLALQKEKTFLWLLLGIVTGAGALTRIDAYITIGALLGFVSLYIALSKRADLMKRIKNGLLFTAAAGLVAFIGWLDLSFLASGYYRDLLPRFMQMLAAVISTLVLGLLMIVAGRKTRLLMKIHQATKRWRPMVLLVLLILVGVFFITRPLWLESHHAKSLPLVGGLQAGAGQPVEPTRDYAENTATWVAWYIGPLLALLGILGAGLMAYKAALDKKLLLIPALFIVLGTIFVFFLRPSITPDQIWASRRLLPVIMPGVAIFGVYALQWLFEQERLNKIKLFEQSKALIVFLIVVSPLVWSYPFLRTEVYSPQLTQINKICDSLPKNAATIWLGTMGLIAPRTVSSFCDKPAVAVRKGIEFKDLDLKTIATKAYDNGYVPIIGADQSDLQHLKKTDISLVSSIQYQTIPARLYLPPRAVEIKQRDVYLGVLQRDGSITPLSLGESSK